MDLEAYQLCLQLFIIPIIHWPDFYGYINQSNKNNMCLALNLECIKLYYGTWFKQNYATFYEIRLKEKCKKCLLRYKIDINLYQLEW